MGDDETPILDFNSTTNEIISLYKLYHRSNDNSRL